ncbi:MAG TPA: type II toxin-antitoxin system VapC family toxin [Bryobacteraceae bacterium]|jgi:predicted nucleic-acid-binding protein|nr:type II toxin-antitoxin system VapC family toxin [Bryobacteraceae bacterium]
MRAADTNLLVRYFTTDDARQVALVDRLFSDCLDRRETIFISIPVICELTWVLSVSHGFAKIEIADALGRLLDQPLFQVEREPFLRRALESYRDGRGGLADYLIGEIASDAGCRDTVTFDKRLKGSPGFTLL